MVLTDIDHPTIAWSESAEKTRILIALRNGDIPRKGRDENGNSTMPLDEVWTLYCPGYSRKKLSGRLGALRKIVDREMTPSGFKEPGKWKKSEAHKLLERDIRKGDVLVEEPEGGDWEVVYFMRPEYAKYDHNKFKKRLETLRRAAKEDSSRAAEDEAALDAYLRRHPVSHFSHQGYEQWQGSEAQLVIWEDINEDRHKTMRKRDLYGSRHEYYEHFPLKTFRDNLRQEIKTEKWRHTLEVKGKQFKAS
jgi:hypothetical protein